MALMKLEKMSWSMEIDAEEPVHFGQAWTLGSPTVKTEGGGKDCRKGISGTKGENSKVPFTKDGLLSICNTYKGRVDNVLPGPQINVTTQYLNCKVNANVFYQGLRTIKMDSSQTHKKTRKLCNLSGVNERKYCVDHKLLGCFWKYVTGDKDKLLIFKKNSMEVAIWLEVYLPRHCKLESRFRCAGYVERVNITGLLARDLRRTVREPLELLHKECI
ncbi:hypothetical protein Tco_1375362 [Tanacetum coccineum]